MCHSRLGSLSMMLFLLVGVVLPSNLQGQQLKGRDQNPIASSQTLSNIGNEPLYADAGALVSVSADQFPKDALGARLGNYLLTVNGDAGLTVVVHQFDEIASTTFPKGLNENGHFDAQDELLLPSQALGKRWLGSGIPPNTSEALTEWLRLEAQAVYQIKFKTPLTSGYAYLWRLKNPVPVRFVPTQDYVTYDQQTYFAETDFYSLASDLENPLVWQDLVIDGTPKAKPKTLIDRLSMRLVALTLGNTSSIQLTNSNVRAQVYSVVDGPLRIRVRIKARAMFAGFVVGHADCQLIFTPRSVKLQVGSQVPTWVSPLLSKASLSLSIDGAQLMHGRVTASGTPLSVGVIDGRLSAVESLFAQSGFEKERYWWLVSHPEGVVIYSDFSVISPKDLSVRMIYQDDQRRHVDPGRYRGVVPEIGYRVKKLPLKEPFHMEMSLHFDRPSKEYSILEYVQNKKDISQGELSVSVVKVGRQFESN